MRHFFYDKSDSNSITYDDVYIEDTELDTNTLQIMTQILSKTPTPNHK